MLYLDKNIATRFLSFPMDTFNKLLKTKFFNFISSNVILASVFLTAVVIFFSFPSYDVLFNTNEMKETWDAIFLQVQAPFENNARFYYHGSHAEKLTFRFIPALIFKLLNIDNLIQAIIFQAVSLFVFYFLLLSVFYQFLQDRKKSIIFALPICFVVAGHVYASDYRGMFDTLALDFLLLGVLFRNKAYFILLILLAYFTDERALIASPTIFLLNLFEKNRYNNIKEISKELYSLPNIYLFVSWVFYFAIRLYLNLTFGLQSGTGGINLFFTQINRTFYTLYIGLEGFIIPFVIVLLALKRRGNFGYLSLIMLSFFVSFFVAQSVIDINRSMSYILLVLILVLLLLDKYFTVQTVNRIILFVIFINLFYDDFYPLLAQLYRMKYISHAF